MSLRACEHGAETKRGRRIETYLDMLPMELRERIIKLARKMVQRDNMMSLCREIGEHIACPACEIIVDVFFELECHLGLFERTMCDHAQFHPQFMRPCVL